MHHDSFATIPAAELEAVTGGFDWSVIAHKPKKSSSTTGLASMLATPSAAAGGAGGGGTGGGGTGGKAPKLGAGFGLGS